MDIKKSTGPRVAGGQTMAVPNRALTSQAVKFSYLLTSRFRFDKPGEYRVRLSLQIGLDDETTQRKHIPESTIQPHAVSGTRESVLQIVPAE